VAPIPPTRAWPELEGSPRHHVSKFQQTAASSPEPTTVTIALAGTAALPAIVLATAVPSRSGSEIPVAAASSRW
jgi:hypothetical protein